LVTKNNAVAAMAQVMVKKLSLLGIKEAVHQSLSHL